MPKAPLKDSTQGGGQQREEENNIFFSQSMILKDLRLISRRLEQHTTVLFPSQDALRLTHELVESLVERYERGFYGVHPS